MLKKKNNCDEKLEQIKTSAEQLCKKSLVDGWMDRWVDEWERAKVGIRIAYSHQKCFILVCLFALLAELQSGSLPSTHTVPTKESMF